MDYFNRRRRYSAKLRHRISLKIIGDVSSVRPRRFGNTHFCCMIFPVSRSEGRAYGARHVCNPKPRRIINSSCASARGRPCRRDGGRFSRSAKGLPVARFMGAGTRRSPGTISPRVCSAREIMAGNETRFRRPSLDETITERQRRRSKTRRE